MTTTANVQVVLCDDHPVYRRGLQVLFDEIDGIEVVGEAPDGEHAIDVVANSRPDVVVMDLHLPGSSGVEATRQLLADQTRPGRADPESEGLTRLLRQQGGLDSLSTLDILLVCKQRCGR